MTEYDNRNRGTLFVNEKKEPGSKQADRNGSATLVCPHCGGTWDSWLDGWVKKSKDGVKQFLSLSFKPKEQKRNSPPRGAPDFQAPRQQSRGRDEDFI